MDTLNDEDVFNAVYIDLAPSIDASLTSSERLFKEENCDFFIQDIQSPLHEDAHSPGFYSLPMPNFEPMNQTYSDTCSPSPSQSNSPFLTSPSQYHTFQFPSSDMQHDHVSHQSLQECEWLNEPIEEHITNQVLICRWVDCKGTFNNQEDLVQHIERSHVDQRRAEDFTCFWAGCPRRHRPFNARYKLLIHMRVHSGEKPNRCSVSCLFPFRLYR